MGDEVLTDYHACNRYFAVTVEYCCSDEKYDCIHRNPNDFGAVVLALVLTCDCGVGLPLTVTVLVCDCVGAHPLGGAMPTGSDYSYCCR